MVRALALPANTDITFRYDKKHVSLEVLGAVEQRSAIGRDVVIAYVDQSNSAYVPFVVPCRKARVREVNDFGITITLIMQVGEFACASDVERFQVDLRREGADRVPTWKDGKLQGSWLLSVEGIQCHYAPADDLATWHTIVHQLVARKEFEAKSAFLKILGIKRPKASAYEAVSRPDNWYNMAPGKEYVLDIYHYHPSREAAGNRLQITVSREDLVRPISASSLEIDSRYDQKRFRFITSAPLYTERVTLVANLLQGGREHPIYQFHVAATIRASISKAVLRVASIGVFVALPGLISATANDKLTWVSGILIAISGLGAGIASTFLLPRGA